jgi:hypothetical protein
MARTKISEFSATPASNTDIDSIFIGEGMAPSNVNDAIRELMAQLKDFQTGAVGDSFNGPVGSTTASTGAFTTVTATGNIKTTGGALDSVYSGTSTGSTLGSFRTYGSGSGVTAETSIRGILNTGSITSSYLEFQTSSSGTLSEKMRLTSDGNLGLGVTPSGWASGYRALDIGATAAITASSNTFDAWGNAYYNGTSTLYKSTQFATMYRQEVSTGKHIWFNAPSGTAGNAITFTQAMTLDASGRLLVGTTSGTQRLTVNSSMDVTDGTVTTRLSQAGGAALIGTSTNHAFFFMTNDTERARIDSSGNFIIGQTATPLAGDGQFFNSTGRWTTRQGSGGIYAQFLNSSGTEIGRISNNSNAATVFSTTSDYRLKEEVTPMTGALAKIAALKPVSYKWKSTGDVSQGFIAHELQAVIPDAVVGEKDAIDENGQPQYQSIDTSFLVATLTAALQELDAKFEAYKATHP